MLPRLFPPVPPFHPAYPRAWFMQLDACLAVNGVTAQTLMHDILLDAIPAELRHLSAASSSSPQPYDDLCAAVLARYGETYRLLPGTREFRVSPTPTRVVPPGPQPSHNHDLPSPATSLSTSRPATSAVVPAPDDQPDDVQVPAPDDVPAAIDQSATRCVSSTPSADGPSGMPAICPSSLSSPAHDTSLTSASTLATLPHDMEADTDNLSPAVRPSLAEVSPSTISQRDLPSTSELRVSCQQRPASPSTSPAAAVRAPHQLRPNMRDAATMTESPEDDMPVSSKAAPHANVTPATTADVQHSELRTGPHVPSTVDASPSAGAPSEPAGTPPARLHHGFPPELLMQDAAHTTSEHHPSALITTPTMTDRTTGNLHRAACMPAPLMCPSAILRAEPPIPSQAAAFCSRPPYTTAFRLAPKTTRTECAQWFPSPSCRSIFVGSAPTCTASGAFAPAYSVHSSRPPPSTLLPEPPARDPMVPDSPSPLTT
ncbi:hypothetical protein HPB52_019629 [Rhipicephalus sanguineus]|uniref:DUF7041 domain-containing protein n=1 Tax=Rhipicephalus sanguineus TaxID=34632 RepID=A0A9D4PXK2_RHISA|nr:hypothetical protein HPB52_019629 [Rhipicephalus sanguineus]